MFDPNDLRHQGYLRSKDGKRKRFDFNLRKCVPEKGGYTKNKGERFSVYQAVC
jgi:hypothetical protein